MDYRKVQNNSDLSEEMKEKMTEYLLSLHGIKEESKAVYISKIKVLGRYLTQKRGLKRFEDAKAVDLNLFLARYNSEYTLNVCIYVIKSFYNFIKRPEVTETFRLYTIQPEQITPSETLTPDLSFQSKCSKLVISMLICALAIKDRITQTIIIRYCG